MFLGLSNKFNIRHQLVFSLGPRDLHNVATSKDIVFTKVTPDNIDSVLDFRDVNHLENFKKFLDDGQVGIYAWLDSKVVGHGWGKLCNGNCCRVNGYMDILHGEALIHYCNVKDAFRGNSIYPSMLIALSNMLFSEGARCVLIDTEIDNIASCKGIAKVGFKLRERCFYIQFCGRLLYAKRINMILK